VPDVTEGYYWARIECTAEVEIIQIIPGECGSAELLVLRMGSEQVLSLNQIRLLGGPISLPAKYL
jgi:hypothetical protein